MPCPPGLPDIQRHTNQNNSKRADERGLKIQERKNTVNRAADCPKSAIHLISTRALGQLKLHHLYGRLPVGQDGMY